MNREGVRDIKWFSHDESSTNSDLFKHASNSHITLVAGLNQNILILKEGALPDNLSIANWQVSVLNSASIRSIVAR